MLLSCEARSVWQLLGNFLFLEHSIYAVGRTFYMHIIQMRVCLRSRCVVSVSKGDKNLLCALMFDSVARFYPVRARTIILPFFSLEQAQRDIELAIIRISNAPPEPDYKEGRLGLNGVLGIIIRGYYAIDEEGFKTRVKGEVTMASRTPSPSNTAHTKEVDPMNCRTILFS